MNDGETQCASSLSSRPHTPTPEDDPSVPLPGRTGVHISDHSERNRDHALHNSPIAGNHPVTGVARVKDERLPIMLHNPHHATSTTVEYLPGEESHRVGGHMANVKAAIERAGRNTQEQLRSTPSATMGDGETRCPVFCTADIPATTLDLLLECTEEYLSKFNSPNYTARVSDRLIIDTKDIATITKGSSLPIASSPTAFLGLSLKEVRDWFDANITQPHLEGFMPHCFLVIDDESTEDDSCIFVCTQDSAPGEIHSLRCDFEVALQNVVACGVQGKSIEEGLMGSFMRSGMTMTKENLKLAQDGGLYIEDGELRLSWIKRGEILVIGN